MSESPRESLHRIRWTLLALGAGLLPHVFHLPFWVTATVVATALWRLVIAHRQSPLPGRVLRILGAILAFVAVLISYRTINGLEAGSALLALMAALKLLETRALRDHVLLILIACFLVLAAILYDQSLVLVPYYAFAVWLAITALCAVTRISGIMPWRRALAMSGRMLLYAAPLGLLLFVLFPRVPGPFWALPNSSRAMSGLGDEMSPGEISDLTLSDDPAFRVRFHGAVPRPVERYWRGPVLHDFDGLTWRRARNAFLPRQPLEFSGTRYSYRIMLEPNNHPWLFALDQPADWQGDETVFQGYDYQLQFSRPVTQPLSYELSSYTRHASNIELAQSVRRRETQLPPGRNPRTIELASELRAANPDTRTYIAAVLDLFVHQGFTYTLTPPRLDQNSIDDFLFNTRQGFCGHYASAFTMLMRAAGIPARVVTGYQGGIYNRVGEYWYVSQADAHAWSEVWFEGVGWQRIDPTSVVAPERLENGIDAALAERAGSAESWFGTANWLRQVGFVWDAVDTWWRDRVLAFDRFKQRAFLEWLGVPDPDWGKLGILLAAGFAAYLFWITYALQRQHRSRPNDPLHAVYQRFCRAAARLGVERRTAEGPMDFSARLKLAVPDAAPVIDEFIGGFVRARYLEPGASPDLVGLARLARTLGRHRISK